jgi:hypothetical protein
MTHFDLDREHVEGVVEGHGCPPGGVTVEERDEKERSGAPEGREPLYYFSATLARSARMFILIGRAFGVVVLIHKPALSCGRSTPALWKYAPSPDRAYVTVIMVVRT